jgi:V/A-type H+-transporting ATPase subunit I
MLRPARMKRFYLVALQRDEDKVSDILGSLRIVELEKERSEIGREVEEVEDYARFLRNIDRLRGTLASLTPYLPVEKTEKSFTQKIREAFGSRKEKKLKVDKLNREEFIKISEYYEKITDEVASNADKITKRINEIDKLISDISHFEKNNIFLDISGDYMHIFVKAGFIPIVNIPKLLDLLRPYNVIYSVLEGRPRENLLVIAASQKDKADIEKALTILNFEEFVPPEGIDRDPSKAISELKTEKKELIDEIKNLKNEIDSLLERVQPLTKYVKFVYKVKTAILRTRNLTIFDGWIPADKTGILEEQLKKEFGDTVFIQFRDPSHHDNPPTYLKHPPILNKFELLTFKEGTPNYNEVNPTPIYTILFAIMYGIMFGDIGQGAILLVLGLLLSRLNKPLLGISPRGINKLGGILAFSALFSILFGFLYGESFLVHIMDSLWLNPIKDIVDIMVFSIVFGLIQIIIGLLLNIINLILHKEYLHAIFSWKGVIGLVYYVTGIYLAIQFIIGGLTLSVFAQPQNLPYVIIALAMLGLIFFSPAIITLAEGKKEELGMSLMLGFGEFFEGFISYLTNSISYVRLGAFAVAHVALGETAYILSASINPLLAYILMNILVIILEGFAAGVQSIRLIYYEFSTKFYMNNGRPYKPLKI